MRRFSLKGIGLMLILIFGLTVFVGNAYAKKTEEDPYLEPDETWISIDGTAIETTPQSFTLDYGDNIITVEMDGWQWYEKDREKLEGDRVTVYGEVDDNMYSTDTIEASSVYVENMGTYFYASDTDEEGDKEYGGSDYWVTTPVEPGATTVRGTVSDVEGREFIIDEGEQELRIDTRKMPYNPLDNKGYQNVEEGDYVSVTGEMSSDFWEKQELIADSVITLDDD
ncbi:MAG: hypothetical protein U5L07_19110 [Desulfobacterales bacterium]|nr:hypothetical protein [Desulfobacterales bacterium]